jgi:hypothetical protein
MDPDSPALGSKSSRNFTIFKDGFPEEWIKWVMAFCEIDNLNSLKEPADNIRLFRNLLRVKTYFALTIILGEGWRQKTQMSRRMNS